MLWHRGLENTTQTYLNSRTNAREKGNFEIEKWPLRGWRKMDPHCGDEAGTTEGHFDVTWQGDYFYGKNLAINTVNNVYLDGLGALPERASHDEATASGDGKSIYLWVSFSCL